MCPPLAVSIRYDSEYAAKSIQGIFNGEKNTDLIATIRKVYRSLTTTATDTEKHRSEGSGNLPRRRRVVVMNWTKVKAHSGDRWNERADQLATRGISGEVCAEGRFLKQQQQQQEAEDDEGEEQQYLDVDASTGNGNLSGSYSVSKKRRLDR